MKSGREETNPKAPEDSEIPRQLYRPWGRLRLGLRHPEHEALTAVHICDKYIDVLRPGVHTPPFPFPHYHPYGHQGPLSAGFCSRHPYRSLPPKEGGGVKFRGEKGVRVYYL